MKLSRRNKSLTSALLSSLLLLSACQSSESTQVKINPSLRKTAKTPDLTYGVKDNSIYDKPKIVQYNPFTGDKKTIFEAPPAPSEVKKEVTQNTNNTEENLPVPSLPKAEFKQRLSARLADLLGEQRGSMFDAQISNLNRQERDALVCLRRIINPPLAKNNIFLPTFTNSDALPITFVAERCFYEASQQLAKKEVNVATINKLAEKYWQIKPNWDEVNSSFISYDKSKQIFNLKNGNSWEQARYLGSDLIDISLKSSEGYYYINAHEINYHSFNDLLSDNSQKSILRQAGIITCGDWLIGYYDNRFESSHIKNGGIIFADYYWLDAFDYELKPIPTTNDFYIASKSVAFGSKKNDNYKPRLCQPISSKRLNWQQGKLNLKTREHYLAAALPKRAIFKEQVVADYINTDNVLYLNIPFNDYVLVFSLERQNAKKPAFVPLNKLAAQN